MALDFIGKAFSEGVKAALKLFQKDISREVFAKSGEAVFKSMEKVAKAAVKAKLK